MERVEEELMRAAATRYTELRLAHMYQPHGTPAILNGREPDSPFWIFLAECR
jgi:hypothetical protein